MKSKWKYAGKLYQVFVHSQPNHKLKRMETWFILHLPQGKYRCRENIFQKAQRLEDRYVEVKYMKWEGWVADIRHAEYIELKEGE